MSSPSKKRLKTSAGLSANLSFDNVLISEADLRNQDYNEDLFCSITDQDTSKLFLRHREYCYLVSLNSY